MATVKRTPRQDPPYWAPTPISWLKRTGKTEPVVIREKVEQVQTMFRLRLEGKSCREIAIELGLITDKRAQAHDQVEARRHGTFVLRLLKDTRVLGWKPDGFSYPKIVDEVDFAKVQELLSKRGRRRSS